MKTLSFKTVAARLGVPLQRLVRAYWLRIYVAHALQGVVANPDLLAWAKENAAEGGNGDVPDNLAKMAVIYADRRLAEIPPPPALCGGPPSTSTSGARSQAGFYSMSVLVCEECQLPTWPDWIRCIHCAHYFCRACMPVHQCGTTYKSAEQIEEEEAQCRS